MLKTLLRKIQEEICLKIVLYWFCMITLTTLYMYLISSTTCTKAVVSCLMIAFTFVGSLYIWRSTYHRDHPKMISRRFASVTVTSFISPIFIALFAFNAPLNSSYQHSVPHLMGFRWDGIVNATVVPLFLTMILFLGPLLTKTLDEGISHYFSWNEWYANSKNLIWLRNHIMAPLSEEFSFRACMLPLLVNCFSEGASVFVCPVFFGVAHAHHLTEKLKQGNKLKSAVLEIVVQFGYTTIFGAYSAFLFLRTGHFVSPFIVHAFCNHMGFPDFVEVTTYSQPKKGFVIIVYIIGFLTWAKCLYSFTSPSLYKNAIFWQ